VTPRPRSGDIWLTDLSPVVANEQSGIRPCLVISADTYNSTPLRHVIVAPLTTRARGLPHHVLVENDGALDLPSYAMPEYSRAISTHRLQRYFGRAERDTVAAVRYHLRQFLGLSAGRSS